jgi:hypothetical protein
MRIGFELKLPKAWVCVFRGHRWVPSRRSQGFLRCARCGARKPV